MANFEVNDVGLTSKLALFCYKNNPKLLSFLQFWVVFINLYFLLNCQIAILV